PPDPPLFPYTTLCRSERVDPLQAEQVVALGEIVGRVLVLADVDAEQPAAGAARARDVAHQRLDAVVVEAHAVDQRLLPRQPEQRSEEHTSELQSRENL